MSLKKRKITSDCYKINCRKVWRFMEEKLALIELTEAHGPSGRENMIHPLLEKYFSSYGEVWSDNINNL